MKILLHLLLFITILDSTCHAWIRGEVSDREAAKRADIIVVARLKKDSLVITPKKDRVSGGKSASAVLIISEVLKGSFALTELPIEIAYGLTPYVGGETYYLNTQTGEGYPCEGIKVGEIKIFDTGNSRYIDFPITGDLNKNQIWLFKIAGDPSKLPKRKLRVHDPEDIQPLSKKAKLLKHIEIGEAEKREARSAKK